MIPTGNEVPRWVIGVCAAAIALGTMAGGKRIIKTMGTKIIRIAPLQGFAGETSGTLVILAAVNWAFRYPPRTASTPASWASAPETA